MKMNAVTIIGSINLDTTLRVKEMPKPGETIHAIEHLQQVVVKEQTKQSQRNVQAQKHILLVLWEMMALEL